MRACPGCAVFTMGLTSRLLLALPVVALDAGELSSGTPSPATQSSRTIQHWQHAALG